MFMLFRPKFRAALLLVLAGVITIGFSQSALADQDLVHAVKGVVKSVDKGTKTMVVKSADGTEQTIKWTDKTAAAGGKDVGDSVAEGSKVSVKYTEKAGEKTAVGVKDLGKDTGKVLSK
jgi:hypothetical protein